MFNRKYKRTRNQTPGVIANNAPGVVKQRAEALRLKRLQMAQGAGFESVDKLVGALFKGLEGGRVGWHMLESPQPCQQCGAKTTVAELYRVRGWLLLRPLCPSCMVAVKQQ